MTDTGTTDNSRRAPRRGRARKRAIRAQAARAGVAYSVAARQLESLGLRPHETVASYGRTIYPAGQDAYRLRVIEQRSRRTIPERLADARLSATLPEGRARHLVDRFPPFTTPAGLLYDGAGREDLLAMLYTAVAAGSPGLVPEEGELAWAAELGEETAVDLECSALDREARAVLDREPSPEWPASGLEGARHILDAVLMVAEDGHAPGTRVRIVASPYEGRLATIVGAVWGVSGSPVAYRIRLDERELTAATGELIVLAGQESLPTA